MMLAHLSASILAFGKFGVLAVGGAPQLAVEPAFPVSGSTVEFDLTAAPGAGWALLGALAPAEIDLGAPGELFLDPTDLLTLGGGVVPGSGEVSVTLPVPASPDFVGLEIFAQAVQVSGPAFSLSPSVVLRIEDAPLAGGRATLSVAATPDGGKLYAAHRDDGTLSVVDAATHDVLRELPNGPAARNLVLGPVHVAVDPDGRHVFALNAAAEHARVFDAATDSMVARIALGRGCKRVAFDFDAVPPRVYVTNEAQDAVLVLEEPVPGFFVAAPPLPVEGSRPGPIDVLGDGRLVVADQGSHELEILDPSAPGSPSVDRIGIGLVPHDVVVRGDEVLVAGFRRSDVGGSGDGHNRVLRFATAPSLAPLGAVLEDEGTDYVDLALGGGLLAVTCAGSGTLLVADAATLQLQDSVDLAPGDPVATPQQSAIVAPGGEATAVHVANYFRETLREVQVAGGPPFSTGSEAALAHSGAPRIALSDLTPEEDGDWFFRSVAFFNGTAAVPNLVTCATCHPDGGSDGAQTQTNDVKTVWDSAATLPLGSTGALADLDAAIAAAFGAHGTVGGSLSPLAQDRVRQFLENAIAPPPSPFLGPDGALSPEAQAGKALFEGAAGCSGCHAAPLFVPVPPDPATIAGGVGTGLAPANVSSLRGIWASAPYLHDGSAATLAGVLETDTGDQHGSTSGLSAAEREQLAAYLRTL